MALYETTFMIRPDLSTQQVEALTEEMKSVVTEMGGQIPYVEAWGLRTLAYRVKRNRKAHYVFLQLDAPHDARAEMERRMSLNEDVLRYLSVKVETFSETPTPMSPARQAQIAGEKRMGRRRDPAEGEAGVEGDGGEPRRSREGREPREGRDGAGGGGGGEGGGGRFASGRGPRAPREDEGEIE